MACVKREVLWEKFVNEGDQGKMEIRDIPEHPFNLKGEGGLWFFWGKKFCRQI